MLAGSARSSRRSSSTPASSGGGQRSEGGRSVATRRNSGEIRTWAKEHGIEISERGRIPASVIEQYEAATSAR